MKSLHQLQYLFALALLASSSSSSQSDKLNVTGTWYYFSPEENRMMRSSEYTAYTFSDNGSVSKRTMSEVDKGTYTVDAASNTITLKFVYSSSDIRSESWKIESVGKARIFYRRNITQNMGFEDDLLYVRQKSTAPAPKNTSGTAVNVEQLVIGATYKLSKDTPLAPELNPSDPLAAMAKIKTVMAGGRVKIISKAMKSGYPWYNVGFTNASTGEVEFGWINSVALTNQTVQRVE